MATTQQPDYYVPAPSWWPFKGAVALFGIGLGAALLVNSVPFSWVPLAIGVAILLWMLFGWFGDVIRESEGGVYSKRVDISFRWGMGWFIFSEVMFFAAFFGTLYYLRSISVPELGNMEHKILWPDFKAMWPMSVAPNGTEPYQVMGPWGLPAWNTLILLTSNVGSEQIAQMCADPELMPDPEAMAKSLREPLLKVFPAALLGRIVTIPYFPLSDEMLGAIIKLQLNRIVKRVRANHDAEFVYDDEVVKLVASRCTEVESGGRMIDAILTNTILPRVSEVILNRMLEGQGVQRIEVGVDGADFRYAIS